MTREHADVGVFDTLESRRVFTDPSGHEYRGNVGVDRPAGYSSGDIRPLGSFGVNSSDGIGGSGIGSADYTNVGTTNFITDWTDIAPTDKIRFAFGVLIKPGTDETVQCRLHDIENGTTLVEGPQVSAQTNQWSGWNDPGDITTVVSRPYFQAQTDPNTNTSTVEEQIGWVGIEIP